MDERKKIEELDDEELEAQEPEELPDREVMSVITPVPVDADPWFPVEGDPGDRW